MLNYTDLAQLIVRDITHHVRDLSHIDPGRVAIVAAARCTGRHTGNLAHCCGLRNEPQPTFSIWTTGHTRRVHAVSRWFQAVMPRVRLHGVAMHYLIQLRLPRILVASPLETLVHELYHIGERFDGRVRPVRHGRYFDSQVRRLMREWLSATAGELPRLSQMTFRQLVREHGAVLAMSLPVQFKIPYVETVAPPESYRAGIGRLYPGYRLSPDYAVRRIELNAAPPMTQLTERDLVLRSYDLNGMRRLPSLYARYVKSPEALSA